MSRGAVRGRLSNNVQATQDAPQTETSLRKTAKLWEVSTGKLIKTLEGHSIGLWTLAFSPDGETLATGSADDTAKRIGNISAYREPG